MRHEDTSTRLSAIHVLAGMGDLSIVEELDGEGTKRRAGRGSRCG